MRRGTIISCALFCPVCQIFNHAAKHTHHIERTLKSRSRLRDSLARWTYTPDTQTAITTTAPILHTLKRHPAQHIRSLLNNYRSQQAHLYKTRRSNRDPDRDNPQSPLTHALYNFARTLNIPSSQHSIANPRPTAQQ